MVPKKTNRPQINWRKSSPQATCHQGCTQKCTSNWRCQESSSLPPSYRGPSWDSSLSKVYWTFDPKAAIPTSCTWNHSRFQHWLAFPKQCSHGTSRSCWSLLGRTFRRHQLVRYPLKEDDLPVVSVVNVLNLFLQNRLFLEPPELY